MVTYGWFWLHFHRHFGSFFKLHYKGGFWDHFHRLFGSFWIYLYKMWCNYNVHKILGKIFQKLRSGKKDLRLFCNNNRKPIVQKVVQLQCAQNSGQNLPKIVQWLFKIICDLFVTIIPSQLYRIANFTLTSNTVVGN